MAKYITVGDIHGRYDLLVKLLGMAESRFPDHRLIFLGDMVDRGPDSFQVVDTIKKLTETTNAIALLGNHEDMMLEYARKRWVDRQDNWMYNGGRKTVESYGKATKLYGNAKFFTAFGQTHQTWMRDLPIYYETDEIWISHAPVPAADVLRNRRSDFRIDKELLTWATHHQYGGTEESFAYDHGKLAVCGHVHALTDKIMGHRRYKSRGDYDKIVYADSGSGCWHAAPLSGVVIDEGKVQTVLEAWPVSKEESEKSRL